MRKTRYGWWVMAVALWWLIGCGGDRALAPASGGDAGDPPPATDEAATVLRALPAVAPSGARAADLVEMAQALKVYGYDGALSGLYAADFALGPWVDYWDLFVAAGWRGEHDLTRVFNDVTCTMRLQEDAPGRYAVCLVADGTDFYTGRTYQQATLLQGSVASTGAATLQDPAAPSPALAMRVGPAGTVVVLAGPAHAVTTTLVPGADVETLLRRLETPEVIMRRLDYASPEAAGRRTATWLYDPGLGDPARDGAAVELITDAAGTTTMTRYRPALHTWSAPITLAF